MDWTSGSVNDDLLWCTGYHTIPDITHKVSSNQKARFYRRTDDQLTMDCIPQVLKTKVYGFINNLRLTVRLLMAFLLTITVVNVCHGLIIQLN